MTHWQPGIGDPTIVGWVTVILYLLAAVSCLRTAVAIRSAAHEELESGVVWVAFTVVLLCLGLNKQLDLQSALTEVVRASAFEHGWYEDRRLVQFAFIVSLGMVCASAMAIMFVRLRKSPFATVIAALGVAIVGVFVVIRAASFHHFDEFADLELLRWRWTWLLEMGGICLMLAGGARRRADIVRESGRVRLDRPAPFARAKPDVA